MDVRIKVNQRVSGQDRTGGAQRRECLNSDRKSQPQMKVEGMRVKKNSGQERDLQRHQGRNVEEI